MDSRSNDQVSYDRGSSHDDSAEKAASTRRLTSEDVNWSKDLEANRVHSRTLINDIVHDFAWQSISVQVKDRKTKKPLTILTAADGMVRAGEMLAIMGPSGSGKTTLLNAIAHRLAAAGATTSGHVLANGSTIGVKKLRQVSSYVEQEDALIGSLTVRETMRFAAGLSLSRSTSRVEQKQRVEDLIASFGLRDQADTIVGTPIKKGLSGGQKKRLGVASRLVTDPKIIFLDEPTSGLDSTLSYEVMAYIRDIAKRHNLIVIASIHQPSTSTFKLFDKLCLLAKGKTCFFGPLPEASNYFASIGHEMPLEINPAEHYLDLINTDLIREGEDVEGRINQITTAWSQSAQSQYVSKEIVRSKEGARSSPGSDLARIKLEKPSAWVTPLILLHRSWIKSYRDVVAYGIRIVMYLGLAILMGTVFLRLKGTQTDIQPYINAIFFGGAFMSFMAVAYIPAFVEDLHTYKNERANGLVGPLAFSISNFVIGLPFLFIIAALFCGVQYFLSGFRQDAGSFFVYLLWLFLDLVAAESLVVLVSVIFPVFVVALALTAFANGLWMCVDGFLVPMTILNPFWKFVFHYIDYQAYVFQGMMVNEFQDRDYTCQETSPGQYHCMFPSDLNAVGKIRGTAILQSLGIEIGLEKTWIGIMIGIIFGYRLLAYIVLRLRKR